MRGSKGDMTTKCKVMVLDGIQDKKCMFIYKKKGIWGMISELYNACRL